MPTSAVHATTVGHASVTITYDRYGHLMPRNEDEAAALLDAYLERANTRARLAAVERTFLSRGCVASAVARTGAVSFAGAHANRWASVASVDRSSRLAKARG